jgi:hypothetical protein
MTLVSVRRIILSFVFAGFLVAFFAGGCMDFKAPDIVTEIATALSPALWLFLEGVLGWVPFPNYHVVWWFSLSLLAIVNAMFYAVVGAIVAGIACTGAEIQYDSKPSHSVIIVLIRTHNPLVVGSNPTGPTICFQ